jgi:dihydrofolate reductase
MSGIIVALITGEKSKMAYAGKIISVIAAVADNGVIGNNGSLPWHNSDDLKWFKHITMGKTVIVGRKTFDTLPPLPGRELHVLSRAGQLFKNPNKQPVRFFTRLEDAIAEAPTKDVFVAGGAEIYKAILTSGWYDRLLISRIRGDYTGDTYFPRITIGV